MNKFKIRWLGSWIFGLWPLFLFVSQKLLVPLKFVELISGFKGGKLKIFGWAVILIISLSCLLLFSSVNDFSLSHYLAVSVFILFVSLFGIENVEVSRVMLNIKLLTYINLFMLFLAFIVNFFVLDLSPYRGLNFVKDSDGVVNRMFIETSSLFVISNFRSKSKLQNTLLIVMTSAYLVFLNKSLFLIGIFFYQLYLQYNIQSRKIVFLVSLIVAICFILIFPEVIFRADLIYSLSFKLSQIYGIIENLNMENVLLGEGFGFYLQDYATDAEQPYQIENQLPMLFLQLGLFGFLSIMGYLFYFFYMTCQRHYWSSFLLFCLIGLINPWLFLPSWLITSTYFFKVRNYV